MMDHEKVLKALKILLEAVLNEFDMDAVSSTLGEAVNNAEQVYEEVTATRRNNAFMDQSKW